MIIKPILFNTEMVRAILGGRKTVTRRLVKFKPGQNPQWSGYIPDGMVLYGSHNIPAVKSPYKSEDILYVRETWRVRNVFGDIARGDRTAEIEFMAGGDTMCVPAFDYSLSYGAWKPSIHMPKEAARLFLRVKRVRVERLQDIDISGIRAEGINTLAAHAGDVDIAIQEFALLWDSTIKKDDLFLYEWKSNPWVWVIEFERCEKPVEVNCNG